MKTGALYIRVSTHMQEELSPDAQRRLLLDYAAANNIIIPKEYIFVENGISGRKAEKRPQFQRMITLARSVPPPFDIILVWKFSRFARNQEESIVFKSLLRRECGIDVTSVSEPLADGPFGSLIERIIEWMDEFYSTNLSEEVFRGMYEKALQGGYQARPPLGYKIPAKGEPPVIVEEEAKIVRVIFDKYVNEKKSFYDIAKFLNSCGFKTSHKKPFETRSVEYIVQNPVYCGMIRWNRTENETNRIKNKDEWIISEGRHNPIISKDLFDAAQERFRTTYTPKGSRPSSSYKHWLSGLIKCPACGRTMTAKVMKRKTDGRRYVYFNCYGYAKGKCLASNSISSLKLEPEILAALKEILDSKEITFKYKETVPIEEINEQSLLEEQLNKLSLKESRIKKAYRNGIDTLDEYRNNKEILAKERQAITSKLDCMSKLKSDAPRTKQVMPPRIQNVYELLNSGGLTDQQKNEMLKSIVEKLVYDKESNTLDIYYHLPKA